MHHCQRAHKTSAKWWNLSSLLYRCFWTSRFLFAIKPLLQTNLMRWRLNTLLLIAFQTTLPPAMRLLASATSINSSYWRGRLTAGSRCSLGVLGSCFSSQVDQTAMFGMEIESNVYVFHLEVPLYCKSLVIHSLCVRPHSINSLLGGHSSLPYSCNVITMLLQSYYYVIRYL